MRESRNVAPWLLSIVVAAAAGCAADAADERPGSSSSTSSSSSSSSGGVVGQAHGYVVNELILPTSLSDATRYGMNLDNDSNDRVDNVLGHILSAVSGQGDVDLSGELARQLRAGLITLLVELKATALDNAASAGAWVYLGEEPSTSPCGADGDTDCGLHFSGDTHFLVAADSPTDTLLEGAVVSGAFEGGPGNVTLQIALSEDAAPVELNLIGVRMRVDSVTDEGLAGGVIAGGLLEHEIRDNILPAIHQGMAEYVALDCDGSTPPCCTGSTGQTIIDLFDESPQDCVVTLEEFQSNALISTLIAPDIDLLDASGEFNPGVDGVADVLSVGLGFSAVRAVFDAPVSE